MNFVLQQAFSVAFAMVLDHVHSVLAEEFEYKYEPLTFICTVPESAQLDQSIFTRNALVNGLVMLKQHDTSISSFKIAHDQIYSVSEPIACFFQIRDEAELNFEEQQKIAIVDCGGCTIDISIFSVVAAELPQYIAGKAISGGGSYVNIIFEDILAICDITTEAGIKANSSAKIMAYLKCFETERKFEIFRNTENDEMFEYKLDDFVFDVEKAVNAMGDNIYYTIDEDKVLYIQQSYYLMRIDKYVQEVKDIIDQYVNEFGTISYTFITGGFLNCKYMQTQLSAMLNLISSVVLARQPSTTVCSGATKIFDFKLKRKFKYDVIMTANDKNKKVFIKANSTFSQ